VDPSQNAARLRTLAGGPTAAKRSSARVDEGSACIAMAVSAASNEGRVLAGSPAAFALTNVERSATLSAGETPVSHRTGSPPGSISMSHDTRRIFCTALFSTRNRTAVHADPSSIALPGARSGSRGRPSR